MSNQQPRITLRPPPHRDYLQGYPGIPASDPSIEPPPTPDPLLPLPHVLRPQAHLSGTVEVRSPLKGGPIRARWLSVELEKIETVPTPPGGESAKSKSADPSKKEGRYVELIGVGPNKLWEAGVSEGADVPKPLVVDSPRKKGLKGIFSKASKAPVHDEEDDDDGFDFIPYGNYPFKIPLPEGLPPTVEVDSKYNGVAYQIVASLCTKGKKGLLKGSTKPAIFIASASILLNKADILPTWPAYAPVLPTPLPPKLPWAAPAGELTVGETREARLAIRREDGTAGEVWMKTTREALAFGPGDAVRVFVQIGWGGERPIKLTRLDFVLRETLTYRHPSPSNQNFIVRGAPKVTALFTANASVSPDPENPTAFAVLYENEPVAFDLTGIVPNGHNRVTVRTAKHVDVAYHLKVRAMLEGGDEVAVDNWPVVIGNCDSRTAKGIMLDIGFVEGLCDRGGLAQPAPAQAQALTSPRPAPQRQASMHVSPAPTASPIHHPAAAEQLPPAPSPIASYQDAALEKSRLLNSSFGPGESGFHVMNPSGQDELSRYRNSSTPPPPLAAPAPVRPAFVPSPSAEDEKRSYYEQATRQRDALQSSLRSSHGIAAPSPVSAAEPRMSESLDTPSIEDDHSASHQRAAIVRRDSRDGLSRPAPVRAGASDRAGLRASQYVEGGPTFATAHLAPTRSNTIMALSGSDVSVSPPAMPSPPAVAEPARSPPREHPTSPAALLGRSLTTAEAEKRRLFLDAKEMARKRQEEARLELERQNQALAELEFEEAQLAYEARLVAEAEDERREVERLAREAFEADRLERIRLDEERWQREEEERQAQARREIDERKRRAQEAMEAELRRFEAQHAEAERARAEEIERQMDERKREDEAKRAMAEQMRRLDEERAREEQERKFAASRKAEMERQRADAERRRLEGEQARLADFARRQAEEADARRRYEEAERERVRAEEEEQDRVRAEEEERYRREEEERRYEAEEAERRRYEEEERGRLAEKDRQRAAEAEARRSQQTSQASTPAAHLNDPYSHPAYPAANCRSASYTQHVGAGLERAPSVASFAPSMSAAHATAEFYAQAIGQQSGLSEEKARYLAQLREQRGQVASPSPYGSSAPRAAYQDPAALQPAYPQGPAYPQPPQPPAHPAYASPPTRQNSYAPSSASNAPALPPKPALPSHTAAPTVPPAAPASSSTSTYQTAAEEKEEAAARRRAEDEAAAARRRARNEKAELERYYSAKAAVDAQQRQAPPPPPSRFGTAPFDRSPLTSPVPTYQPAADDQPTGPAYPSQLGHGSLRASTHTIATMSDGSSHELHRDPSVAAGKRAQRPPSSSAASDSLGYLSPSPAPVPYASEPAHDEPAYAYQPAHHPQPQRQGSYGAPGQPQLGGVEFGSFRMDEFPEFDELSQQIAAANAARANGGRTP
ncbi:hypothetical protein JCM10449v2_008216 [Rhodotorula kratochvilovae]